MAIRNNYLLVQNYISQAAVPRNGKNQKKGVRCKIHKIKFDSLREYSIHYNKTHERRCKEHDLTFQNKNEYDKHIRDNHERRCREHPELDFANINEYRQHRYYFHPNKTGKNCYIHGLNFDTDNEYQLHYSKHHEHRCKIHNLLFPNSKEYKRHCDQTHIYRCRECGNIEFEGISEYRKHRFHEYKKKKSSIKPQKTPPPQSVTRWIISTSLSSAKYEVIEVQ